MCIRDRFLAGPLARDQISRLMEDRKAALAGSGDDKRTGKVASSATCSVDPLPARPVIPAGIEERFAALNRQPASSEVTQIYRPALYAEGAMHFIRKTANLDLWRDARRIVACDGDQPDAIWQASEPLPDDIDWLRGPEEGFSFAALPDPLLGKRRYTSYKSQFKDYLYRHFSQTLYKSTLVKGYAPPGDQSDARAYFADRIREQRDVAIEKLRDKYKRKLVSLEKKIQTAEDRVARERGQSRTSMISAGSSVLGALLGGFLGGRRTQVSTAARGVGYAAQQSDDVRRAEQALQLLEDDKEALNDELADDLDALRDRYNTREIELEAVEIPPRKSDLKAQDPMIVWMPWQVDSSGLATPLY